MSTKVQYKIDEQQDLIGAPRTIEGNKYSEMQNYDHVYEPEGGYLYMTKPQMKYINDMVLAANVELIEMLQELPWKPWKEFNEQEFNLVKAREELADTFIFLYNIARILNMNVENYVLQKLETNIKRLEDGFHKEHE